MPDSFGFPAAVHPRDPETLYLLPLIGDYDALSARGQGRGLAHARRRRKLGGAPAGLPQSAYFAVLRQAMATDRLDPAGVYFGTSTGSLFASADEGESWTEVAEHLPTMLSVETLTLDA